MARADMRSGAGTAFPVVVLLMAALLLSGCRSGSSSDGSASAPAADAGTAMGAAPSVAPPPDRPPSATVGSTSPSPGSCHVRGTGSEVLPDPSCTPGATNPAVSQADIGQTICQSGWTATVRPPESYTEPLKYQQMAAYGDTGSAGDFEEDHLIPLELGGSPTSPRNLWPEPGSAPNPKDSVERAANHAVCDGHMTLAAAQQAIAADWIALGQQLGVAPQQSPGAPVPPAAPPSSLSQPSSATAATCSASASYSSRYGDWDVYIHSNQPDQAVQVVASGGAKATYRTNSSGYADVYLHAPASAGGQSVTVTVGTATCGTTL